MESPPQLHSCRRGFTPWERLTCAFIKGEVKGEKYNSNEIIKNLD